MPISNSCQLPIGSRSLPSTLQSQRGMLITSLIWVAMPSMRLAMLSIFSIYVQW